MIKAVIELSCHSDRAEPQISHHLPSYTSVNHGPARLSQHGHGGMARERPSSLFILIHRKNTFCTPPPNKKNERNKQKICSIKSDKQPGLTCAGLSFLPCRSGSLSLTLVPSWSLKQRFASSPSHPLPTHSPSEPPVNTETVNAAQTASTASTLCTDLLYSPQPA